MDRTALIAFLLGIFLRKVGDKVGDFITDPLFKYAGTEVRKAPMVFHYLELHEGRFFRCFTCKLGKPTKVDSIS